MDAGVTVVMEQGIRVVAAVVDDDVVVREGVEVRACAPSLIGMRDEIKITRQSRSFASRTPAMQ